MVAVIQRVKKASVEVRGVEISSIGHGLVVFLGIALGDTAQECDKFCDKILKLRIFSDSHGKMNLSLREVQGEVLLVSEFTLLGELKGQNRPSFAKAAGIEEAQKLYNYFGQKLACVVPTRCGVFREEMQVHLTNDGPVTFVLRSGEF
ncbi:MAG: D-aminoacyl-tRNA deacylase [Leptospiraceae bacterium]|nr:D-aminoacyl-tRNA deacylase [Leptospiraceae bacterium]MDW8306956.1 D-aminoacyl-tRNA deacylase [Leptospiraceae bacterium]